MSNADGLMISCVIPTYNREELVVRALESVFAQTRQPDEIVIVDDGSTDRTEEALREYADRVRYVRQENAGGGAARNTGVENATGDWIAFLDSDDLWIDDHVERIAAAIQATSGRANYYFDDMIRPSGESEVMLWELAEFSIDGAYEFTDDATEWVMLPRQPLMLQSAVFHRRRYLDSGGLDESLVRRHDTHLFFKLGLGQSACAVAGPGSRFTADDDTGQRLTEAFNPKSQVYWESTTRLYREMLAFAVGRADNALPELKRRVANSHWRLARIAWANRRMPSAIREAFASIAAQPARFLERLSGQA